MKAIAHPSVIGGAGVTHVTPYFRDRVDAGARLAERLTPYLGKDALVLGIPRGGVPVAAEVAKALDAELDVIVARKLRSPISAELAIGAVTADGGRFLNEPLLRELGVGESYIAHVTETEMAEAGRREARFRRGAAAPSVAGRAVILVDDGLATGATMIAAARSVGAHNPSQLIVAVPVGSVEACAALRHETDAVICLANPEPFWAVGIHYADFRQTEDDEVEHLLEEARNARLRAAGEPGPAPNAMRSDAVSTDRGATSRPSTAPRRPPGAARSGRA
jgi:putative phosphoribosyl transferase